jgi:hypothetical protein
VLEHQARRAVGMLEALEQHEQRPRARRAREHLRQRAHPSRPGAGGAGLIGRSGEAERARGRQKRRQSGRRRAAADPCDHGAFRRVTRQRVQPPAAPALVGVAHEDEPTPAVERAVDARAQDDPRIVRRPRTTVGAHATTGVKADGTSVPSVGPLPQDGGAMALRKAVRSTSGPPRYS